MSETGDRRDGRLRLTTASGVDDRGVVAFSHTRQCGQLGADVEAGARDNQLPPTGRCESVANPWVLAGADARAVDERQPVGALVEGGQLPQHGSVET
jgi:hypothetical protein